MYAINIFFSNACVFFLDSQQIWDTAGQEEYQNIRFEFHLFIPLFISNLSSSKLSYGDTQVFLVAFSCDKKESLDSLKNKWVPEISENVKDTKPLMIMVGTKVDVRDANPGAPENCDDDYV